MGTERSHLGNSRRDYSQSKGKHASNEVIAQTIERFTFRFAKDLQQPANGNQCDNKPRTTTIEQKTIYDVELDKKAVQNADTMADSALYRNKPLVEFLGSNAEDKTQEMKMGAMTCCYDKRLFIEENMDWFMYFKHLFSERVTFMIFMAMKEMEHDEVEMDAAGFETYFMNYTHGHPEEYAIIDTDSMFRHMLDMRMNDGRLYGADCYDTGMMTGRYISDLPETAEFEKRMIIIRKDDLPVLVPEEGHKAPETSVKEDTDKEKGRAAAWLSVNPHLKLLYNKEIQYVIVKQVPIKG